jgi:serine/threonine protein kinase/regulator of sirC expression with transglutaminase-like and TPR domain
MSEEKYKPGHPDFATIGEYRIEGELGKGGMGIVYKAYQEKLKRHVALKVLRRHQSSNESAIHNFIQEAQASADLHHPNIAPIYDVGQDNDINYFAMEFVDGHKFDEVIENSKVHLQDKLRIIMQVARALNYAHNQGLVHRDVKPGNIMIDKNGRVLLMDFGIARPELAMGSAEEDSEIGTPGYVAPEQAHGQKVDRRADIFSLGAILYDILTVHKSPGRIDHNAPTDIEAVSLKAMSHDRHKRYSTARDFFDDIQRYLNDEPVTARPTPLTTQLARRIRKYKGVSASIGVIIILLLAFAGYYISQKLIERSRWKLVFEDDFERTVLGDAWTPLDRIYIRENPDTALARRIWTIQEGKLVCDHNSHTFIHINRKLTGDIRLEFDAMQADSSTDGIHCFLFCTKEKQDIIKNLGYAFAFGSFKNTTTYISRFNDHLIQSTTHLPGPGVWYHIRAQRRGTHLTLFINGKKVLDAEDEFPIMGKDNTLLGLHSWEGKTYYDNLRIYRSALPLKASPLAFADDLVARGKYDEAISYYEDVMANYPERKIPLEVYYKIATAHLLKGDYDLTRKYLDKIINRNPKNIMALKAMIGKGHACLRQGQHTQAESVFVQVSQVFPGDPNLNEIAVIYKELGDQYEEKPATYDQAMYYYQRALNYVVPDSMENTEQEVYRQIGELFTRQRKYKEAVEFYQKRLKAQPTRSESMYRLGWIYHTYLEDYPKAMEYYTLALKHVSPRYKSNAYTNRGSAYLEIDSFKQALADFSQAIKERNDRSWPYFKRAETYLKLGDTTHAHTDLREAIRLITIRIKTSPDQGRFYSNRALFYYQLGKLDSALADYNRTIDLESNTVWCIYNRAEIFLEMGNTEKANQDFRRCLNLCTEYISENPDRTYNYWMRGRCNEHLGNIKPAIKDFRIIIKITGNQGRRARQVREKLKALGHRT